MFHHYSQSFHWDTFDHISLLKKSECKVVPFFGGFLRDLRLVLMGVPSVVVMPTDDRQEVEVNHDAECWLVVFNVPSTARSFREGTPIYCPLRKT